MVQHNTNGFGRGWVPMARDIGLPGDVRPDHEPPCDAVPPGHPAGGRREAIRHDQFTPQRQVAFLSALAQHGNVRAACAVVGLSPQAAYTHRRRDAALAQGWEAALVLARDVAEQVLADRALNGTAETVYYRGEAVGHRVRFDNRLLLAHLARLDLHCHEAERGQATAARFDEFLDALLSGEADSAQYAEGDGWLPESASRAEHITHTIAEAEQNFADDQALAEAQAQGIDVASLGLGGENAAGGPISEDEDEDDDDDDDYDTAFDAARLAARAEAIAEWDQAAAARHARIDALCFDEVPEFPRGIGPDIAVGEPEPLPPIEVKSRPDASSRTVSTSSTSPRFRLRFWERHHLSHHSAQLPHQHRLRSARQGN